MVKQRIALWDNARGILIILVVVGHMLTTVRTSGTLPYGLYLFIYLFHMPAMILLAGVFSKADAAPKTQRSIVQLLATWMFWEVLWVGIRGALGQKLVSTTFLVNASWSLWFVLTLATMKVMLPYIARFRYPISLSVVIAVASGFNTAIGTEFSVSRTLTFLPFFVIGWAIRQRGWGDKEFLLRPTISLKICAGVFLAAVLAGTLIPGLKDYWRIDEWILHNKPYASVLSNSPIGVEGDFFHLSAEQGGVSLIIAAALIGGLLTAAFLMTWALVTISPRSESILTRLGQRTLFVYLLHGPFIQILRGSGTIHLIGEWGIPGVALLVFLGVLLTVVLASNPIRKATSFIIEPSFEWLKKK